MKIETVNQIMAIVGYVGLTCGLIAQILPPGKVQHAFAFLGNLATKKPPANPPTTPPQGDK